MGFTMFQHVRIILYLMCGYHLKPRVGALLLIYSLPREMAWLLRAKIVRKR